MGRDKGGLAFRGRPLVGRALDALQPFAPSVRVSVRRGQAEGASYTGLPLLVDAEGMAGPAAGLLAAWDACPEAALLVLAVDMPLVDAGVLGHLLAQRAPARAATAFRHPNGIPEPLCAIWEPRAEAAVRSAAAQGAAGPGRVDGPAKVSKAAPSLRRILEAADVAWLEAPDPGRLVSVNTPAALAAAESEESNSSR
jgi:molybdopterin-guanine dinucleotide biosynthesis protein A